MHFGYSKESKIPYDLVFTKSKYIGRTFIQNTQNINSSNKNYENNQSYITNNNYENLLTKKDLKNKTIIK